MRRIRGLPVQTSQPRLFFPEKPADFPVQGPWKAASKSIGQVSDFQFEARRASSPLASRPVGFSGLDLVAGKNPS
jgi:hypothetical protein